MQRKMPRRIVAIIIPAFLACGTMVEGISCNKGEKMASKQEEPVKQAKGSAQERAEKAMQKEDFKTASFVVFNILKEDLDEKTRFDIMGSYARKYGMDALKEIKGWAIAVGSTKESIEELQQTDKRKIGYVKTLAYGIALFGEEGFKATMELLDAGEKIRKKNELLFPFSEQPSFFLVHSIAQMAAYMIVNNGLVNKESAVKALSDKIRDDGTELPEKEMCANILGRVSPAGLLELKNSVSDEATKQILDLHIKESVPSSVKPR